MKKSFSVWQSHPFPAWHQRFPRVGGSTVSYCVWFDARRFGPISGGRGKFPSNWDWV